MAVADRIRELSQKIRELPDHFPKYPCQDVGSTEAALAWYHARLELARDWVAEAHHSDYCPAVNWSEDLNDYGTCTCGRDKVLKALEPPHV